MMHERLCWGTFRLYGTFREAGCGGAALWPSPCHRTLRRGVVGNVARHARVRGDPRPEVVVELGLEHLLVRVADTTPKLPTSSAGRVLSFAIGIIPRQIRRVSTGLDASLAAEIGSYAVLEHLLFRAASMAGKVPASYGTRVLSFANGTIPC